MKSVKITTILVCLWACAVAFIGCQSSEPIPTDWQDQYPLSDYVEVFESTRNQNELFVDARSYLIDNYKNFLSDADLIHVKDDAIMFKYTYMESHLGGTNIGFDVSIEFKDSKIRVGLRNVEIAKWGYGHYQYHEYGYLDLELRKKGSEIYQKHRNSLQSNFQKIADGTYDPW